MVSKNIFIRDKTRTPERVESTRNTSYPIRTQDSATNLARSRNQPLTTQNKVMLR